MRLLLLPPLLLTLTVVPAPGQHPLVLDELIDAALENNPDLEVLRQRWFAEQASAPQAGALADPMLRFDLINVPLSDLDFDSAPMSGRQIMLSQKLPWWGKRAGRQAMARRAAAASEAVLRDREVAIVQRVKSAYFTMTFLYRAIAVTRENEILMRDFVRIAQTKYAVGKGLLGDILKAQVSLSSLGEKLIRLDQQRRRTETELNALLNRLPESPIGRPAPLSLTRFERDVAELQREAESRRPHLRGMAEVIAMWSVAEDLARRDYRPDFDVRVAYHQRDFAADPVQGSDFVSAGVMLNLPIYTGRKQDQQVIEARHRRQAAEAQLTLAKTQLRQRIQMLLVDIDAHRQQTELFSTVIIPQAKQSLAVAMAAYPVDKVDFLALLDSQVKLLNVEVAYYRHLAEHEKALAAVEAEVGVRLF